MGQPITVVSTRSSRPGVVRFEINRCLTGMGHERYRADNEIVGDTPADELARRLFDLGGIAGIHVNSNIITVEASTADLDVDGVAEIIAELHLYYVDGVEVPSDEELTGAAG